jgi:thiol:disulfide interchange protein DsbD
MLAFLGGLILNVMPCVLPVIALKIFGFVRQAGEAPERIFRLGLAFAAGVFAFFFGIAAVVAVLGRAFNWGYQFQNPWLFTALIALVFVFSLNLLGVFEIALGSGTATTLSELSGREGYGGAFLHGMFTTLLGTSCTAPFLAGSLGFATTQPAPIVFLLFGAIAAGMSTPYLLLTARPGWLKYVPKPGAWMERAKQIMGFVMLAVVVWLLSVLATRGAEATGAVLWFLFAVGLACWIYGAFARSIVTWLVIVAVVAGGYFFFLAGAFDRPETARSTAPADGLPWQPFSDEAVAAAIARGEPVFIDFTADWCVNCKFFEKTVINTEPVKKAFAEKKVTLFRADWTRPDPNIKRALQRFNRIGVPLYVLYRPGEAQPVVLDALTTGILLGELAQIKK